MSKNGEVKKILDKEADALKNKNQPEDKYNKARVALTSQKNAIQQEINAKKKEQSEFGSNNISYKVAKITKHEAKAKVITAIETYGKDQDKIEKSIKKLKKLETEYEELVAEISTLNREQQDIIDNRKKLLGKELLKKANESVDLEKEIKNQEKELLKVLASHHLEILAIGAILDKNAADFGAKTRKTLQDTKMDIAHKPSAAIRDANARDNNQGSLAPKLLALARSSTTIIEDVEKEVAQQKKTSKKKVAPTKIEIHKKEIEKVIEVETQLQAASEQPLAIIALIRELNAATTLKSQINIRDILEKEIQVLEKSKQNLDKKLTALDEKIIKPNQPSILLEDDKNLFMEAYKTVMAPQQQSALNQEVPLKKNPLVQVASKEGSVPDEKGLDVISATALKAIRDSLQKNDTTIPATTTNAPPPPARNPYNTLEVTTAQTLAKEVAADQNGRQETHTLIPMATKVGGPSLRGHP